jgi:hemin uptake protein HemP
MSDGFAEYDEVSADDQAANVPPVVHKSADIFQGRTEAYIEHDGERYKLLLTDGGHCLFLTK